MFGSAQYTRAADVPQPWLEKHKNINQNLMLLFTQAQESSDHKHNKRWRASMCITEQMQ